MECFGVLKLMECFGVLKLMECFGVGETVRGAPARDSRGGRVRVAGVDIIRLSFRVASRSSRAFGGSGERDG